MILRRNSAAANAVAVTQVTISRTGSDPPPLLYHEKTIVKPNRRSRQVEQQTLYERPSIQTAKYPRICSSRLSMCALKQWQQTSHAGRDCHK